MGRRIIGTILVILGITLVAIAIGVFLILQATAHPSWATTKAIVALALFGLGLIIAGFANFSR